MNGRKTSLNLASRPILNNRLFRTLLIAAVAVFATVAALSMGVYLTSRARAGALGSELERMDERIRAGQKERDVWAGQSREWAKLDKDTVDAVNAIIRRKSFSWVKVFSLLEEALPPACAIVSVAPLQENGGRVDIRFKVVTPILPDLLALIQKLDTAGFKNISVKNELPTAGQISSEISVTYERTF